MKIKLLAAAFAICLFSALPASARTIHVDVNSRVGLEDGTAERPFTKIQKAADIVEPGDVVIVQPGVYYESVTLKRSGTEDNPIIFKAVKNGEYDTVITAANKEIREGKVEWKCEDEENQIYSVPYSRNVSNVLYNGARMLGYLSLDELKAFEGWPGRIYNESTKFLGYTHGYYWDSNEKKLYVHIGENDKYGDQDPNKNLMSVGGPYYTGSLTINGVTDTIMRTDGISTDSYNFGIETEDSAYVVLSGFTFEVPGWCGVFVRAHDVTIKDCWFRGCISGVLGGRRTAHDEFISENVTIENSDWNLFPLFEDAIDMIEKEDGKRSGIFWWISKQGDGALHQLETGSFFTHAGKNWTVRYNKMSSCLDALSYYATMGYFKQQSGTNSEEENGNGIKIYGNRFETCLDNAIEVENHAQNIDIYDNEFVNIFLPFSWQPLGGTPWPTNIKVHNNVFYDDEELVKFFWDKGHYPLEWLKFGANASQWGTAWTLREEVLESGVPIRPIIMQDKGVWIYNNSVYIPGGYTSEVVGLLVGKDQKDNNSYVFNNLVYCFAQTAEQPYRKYIAEGRFFPINGSGQGWIHKNNICVSSNPGESNLVRESEEADAYDTLEDAGIVMNGIAMQLTENSPARGTGIQIADEERDTTDIGAVPYGENWDIRYGVYQSGDVNSDGKIDLEDVAYLSERIGIKDEDDSFPYRCDLDFNGVIDENDLQLLGSEYFAQN